jgi:cytochrome c-type biogenesis protein CcmH
MVMRWLPLFLLLLLSPLVVAEVETYPFSSDAARDRYQLLVEELRCPKCQNQNLKDSNSPIAADLRRELHRLVEEGRDERAIKKFMVERYGNFVLYRPPFDHNTLVLWLLPAAMVFIALVVVILLRLRLAKKISGQPLAEEERARLDELLRRYP